MSKYLGVTELSLESSRAYMAYLKEKGWQNSSIHADFRLIRAFITFLSENGHTKGNWGRQIKLPKLLRKEIEIVPPDVALNIIEAGTEPGPGDNCLNRKRKEDARACLIFICKTGLRNAEACGLQTEDFNLETTTYVVRRKGGNKQRLPIPADIIDSLRERCSKPGRVFTVTKDHLEEIMRRGCTKLGITKKIRVHSLRHIFGTQMVKDKVPLSQARRLMGHADVRMLDTVYAHLDVTDLAQALNSTSLVVQGLSPTERLRQIEEWFQLLPKDNRLTYTVKHAPGEELNISVSIGQRLVAN